MPLSIIFVSAPVSQCYHKKSQLYRKQLRTSVATVLMLSRPAIFHNLTNLIPVALSCPLNSQLSIPNNLSHCNAPRLMNTILRSPFGSERAAARFLNYFKWPSKRPNNETGTTFMFYTRGGQRAR